MDCVLLGSGGMAPMPYRLLSSLVVRLKGRIYLFDAGEGAQLGWKRSGIGLRGLRVIAVSHLHADHCLGIPGILMLRAQMDDPGPLTVIGPPGIEEFIDSNRRIMEFYLNYPVHFIEWSKESGETAYEDESARIKWAPLRHTRFCLGYRFEEFKRPGKFDPARAAALHAPKGPLWGKLQAGRAVTGTTGKTITPEQVLGPPRRGRHAAFVVDTRPAKEIYSLCKDVDIAFIEGMFSPEHEDHADIKGHLSMEEASKIARRSGAKRAVLIHISPRYDSGDLEALEAELKRHFRDVEIGRDLGVYSVPFAD